MEVKLIYNSEDEKYYLYCGEEFLNDYEDAIKAKQDFDRVQKYVDDAERIHDIRDKFGWKPYKDHYEELE